VPQNSISAAQTIEQQLMNGGRVYVVADPGNRDVSGQDLKQLIVRFSLKTGAITDCVSLTLAGFHVTGELDLVSYGLEGAPLFGLEFIDCDIERDLLLSYAYIKALTFKGATRWVRCGSIIARGVTVIDLIEMCRVNMNEGSTFDLSESRLRAGAIFKEISAVGRKTSIHRGLDRFSLARAVVGSDIEIRGLQVNATGTCAFDAEELRLAGSLTIGCLKEVIDSVFLRRSQFVGELRLQGANISGQLLIEGLEVTAHNAQTLRAAGLLATPTNGTDDLDADLPFPVFSISAEEAVVGGDLSFTDADFDPDPRLSCLVTGQVDLTGMQIGGDLYIYGTFNSTQRRIRAVRATRIKVKGDVRFGYAPWQYTRDKRHCEINGECDFSLAEIGGKAVFSGSTHHVTKNYRSHPELKREQKQAIHLKGATVGSELWFESGRNTPCKVEGLTITGAKIGGRLLVRGADFSAPESHSNKSSRYKCISANGTTIHGGILITIRRLDSGECRRSSFRGGIRLRNAVIDGPVQFESISLRADGSGLALWAGNTRFGSDVLIQPGLVGEKIGRRPFIRGELRFQGAQVRGRLWVQGVNLKANARTGVALDCFTAEVARSVTLGSFCPRRSKGDSNENLEAAPADVTGLVSLVHLRAQSVTIGANMAAGIDRNKDKLSLTGAILMRDCRLDSTCYIVNARLRSVEKCGDVILQQGMLAKLQEWGIFRQHCVVHANYATLGTRLFVRLLQGSNGLISLYAAKTGTIGAITGPAENTAPTFLQRAAQRSQDFLKGGLTRSKLKTARKNVRDPLRENWGLREGVLPAKQYGRPRNNSEAEGCTLLNLDEFSYDRTNDLVEITPSYGWSVRRLLHRLLGRPKPSQLGARFGWLTQIVENPGQDAAVISAHRQLARVYRNMGNIQLSYYYTRERRWRQIHHNKPKNLAQTIIDVSYSAFTGFGYSSKRAIVSLLLLYAFSVGFVITALSVSAGCEAPTSTTCSPAWYAPPSMSPDILPSAGQINRSVVSPSTTTRKPEMTNCVGSLCEPDEVSVTSGFHLPQYVYFGIFPLSAGADNYNILSEAAKLILPLPHLGEKSFLALHNGAPKWLRLWSVLLNVSSWVLFPLAIGTFTGILRENP
jgi:hypothetical protein